MSIISLHFVILAILTYIASLIVPKKHRWIVLLISSIIFYFFAGQRALITMISAAFFSYLMGIVIAKLPVGSRKRKMSLLTGIVFVVGWLVTVKYVIATGWDCYYIVAPLGASYVSFSIISYMVDIYWERDKADRNLLRHLLYVLFFPKISQGPITRHNKTADQLYAGGEMTYHNLTYGIQRMIFGYFKKLVIANRLSMITTGVFVNISAYSGSVIFFAIVFAALELYFDFSGYMDIILGFSQTLGFELDENFRHPFFSKTAAEFWRRWHITLGLWFKDYIYTPVVMSHVVKRLGKWTKKNVGKKFGNNIMKVIALSAVWILTGLWHGTTLNYIIWGLMWGVIIITSAIFEDKYKDLNRFLHINTNAPSWSLFQRIRTFGIFCCGILLTRVSTINDVKLAADKIVNAFHVSDIYLGKLYEFGVSKNDFTLLVVFMIGTLFVSIAQEKQSIRDWISTLNFPVRWVIYALSISIILFFGIYGVDYSTSGFAYTYF